MANTGERKRARNISPMGLPAVWPRHPCPSSLPPRPSTPPAPVEVVNGWSSFSQTSVVPPGNRAERVHLFTTMEKSGMYGYLWEKYTFLSESEGSKSFPLTLLRTMENSCSLHCTCRCFHFRCILRLPCLFMFGTLSVPLLPATRSPLHILLLF